MRRLLPFLLLIPLVFLLGDDPDEPPPRHKAEWLEADGIKLRALRTGQGDTTLVFLHGYGEHLLTWRGVIDPLAKHYRILAVDLPGFGGSDKPDRPYTVDSMVATVRDLLARWTKPPVILVGHSMGGAISAATAAAEPEKVVALVLVAPAGIDVALGGIMDTMSRRRSALIGMWEAARASVTPMHDPAWFEEPPDRARYDPALDPAFRASTARALRDFQFEGLGEVYRKLGLPVLLVWGTADPVVPADVADSLAKYLPCHQLAFLERTLHRPQVERPDAVVAILERFLRKPAC